MIREKIIQQLQQILTDLGIYESITPSLEIPTDLSHGDYTTNVAMQAFARGKGIGERGKYNSPLELAEAITKPFTLNPLPFIDRVEAVKPGFINFWIAKEELGRNMVSLLNDEEKVAKRAKGTKEPEEPNGVKESFRSGLPADAKAMADRQTSSGMLNGKKIFIEYAHPNTHKEMHIGHMRTLITGEALARLFESQGATVFRANYQGDIGPHVAKALYGIEKIMDERGLTLEEVQGWSNYDKAHFLGEGYVRGNTDYEEAKDQIDEINSILYETINDKPLVDRATVTVTKPVSSGGYVSRQTTHDTGILTDQRFTDEKSLANLYLITRQWSLDYYDEFYARFMTTFDRLFFESEVAQRGVRIVKDNIGKVFFEDNGAIIFPGEKYGLHRRVFITKAGYPTYEGKEMGNGFTEWEAFHFDKKIHVVANEQSGYFQVVFKALELLDPDKFKDKQYHVAMGMVQLSDRKISSRTGVVLTVDWLIDQVKEAVKELFKEVKMEVVGAKDFLPLLEDIAIGAVKYSVLKGGTQQNVAFDIQKSVTLEGNSGPYIQYAYARTQSILRKGEGERGKGEEKDEDKKNNFTLYPLPFTLEKEELDLLRMLYHFPEIVQKSAENYAPNLLCEYLFELTKKFNLFYQKHRVLDVKEDTVKAFRLSLTAAVGEVIKEGLGLLGIAAPERM